MTAERDDAAPAAGHYQDGNDAAPMPAARTGPVRPAAGLARPARLRPSRRWKYPSRCGHAGRGRPAAVLILFAAGADGPDVLLIQRAAGLRKHPGQPAFPGGAIDAADGGPVRAALREAREETGVDPAGVRVLAVLPDMYIWRSDFRVTPVLGWWHTPVPVAPGDPGEIAAVLRVPVAQLASPANRLLIRYPGGQASYAFRVAGLTIWGFTAMLLDRILALGGFEQPWDSGRVTTLPADQLPAGWPAPGG